MLQWMAQRVAKRLAARAAKLNDAASPASPLEFAVGRRVTERPVADAQVRKPHTATLTADALAAQ